MLTNINSRGLSKSKKIYVSNFTGATSEDILAEVEDTLINHPDTLIVHAGTNDLTKNLARYKDCAFEHNLPEGQTKHR